jgi:hypothetical protein
VSFETDGAGDMAAILALFGDTGFQIPLSLLIDADATADMAARLGIPESDLNSRSVWVSAPDLEAEYVAAIEARPCGRCAQNSLALLAHRFASYRSPQGARIRGVRVTGTSGTKV